MTELIIAIPKPIWISANDRLHWAAAGKRTAALRALGCYRARAERIGPHGPTRVDAHIGYLTAGRVDPNNASPATKALIDGMTDAGVWPDDNSVFVTGPHHYRGPKSTKPGHYIVRLVLTPLEDA